MPVALLTDTFLIAGCPFTIPPGVPQPCLTAQWLVPTVRVLINAMPAVMQTSVGLCLSPEFIPQGPPMVVTTQVRVLAT